MSKPTNARCKHCSKHKTQPNADCIGSGKIHPLPVPLMGKLPEHSS